MKLKIYPEVCCEECNQVIHNHIDCPMCNAQYASSGLYHELEKNENFSCENCNSEFKLLSECVFYGEEHDVKLIKEGNKNVQSK